MRFKGVIFDLDGTLLDTLEDIADSMNTVLKTFNYPTHSLEKYKILVGMGMKNLVTNALPDIARDEASIEKAFKMMFEEYNHRWDKKTKLYPGIEDLLNNLSSKNIKLAVLSNKIDSITQLIFKKYLYKWEFVAVFGERKGIPRKPDPYSLLEIAKIMELRPEEIVLLGDSGTDMTAANNANMYGVGALWGFRLEEELLLHGAKATVKRPMDLFTLFEK
ncbi:MAG: Phosphoglycolate phosphatase [Spirochaetes bacterium ADurb.Bin218]|jgi:phosphoglycolate phosphatase|nr:HAD family hydrolase [Spirochaetota bacterium]OQA99015.1 MAG: Phosphoglycolate phosphatase [Spirochaetes bacterium ADurb.Bin218]HOQ12235.1 HAD family hydrolase [Spirochaetota bacterium]HOV10046.1 HAD family hydrolase [Spirochaetota bacterium]HPX91409.1 HAD family hydrolase [Spirochaetota bacterium]